MHIESRERTKQPGARIFGPWGDWEICEGTDGLTESECHTLMYQWTKDDREDYPHWLRVEYRIIGL